MSLALNNWALVYMLQTVEKDHFVTFSQVVHDLANPHPRLKSYKNVCNHEFLTVINNISIIIQLTWSKIIFIEKELPDNVLK